MKDSKVVAVVATTISIVCLRRVVGVPDTVVVYPAQLI
jgi:hypothetical protein